MANDEPKFPGFSIPNATPIPDELFDQLLPDLTGNELKVLLYIFRRTLGFKKREDAVALSQLVDGIVHREPDGTETRLDRGAGVSRRGAMRAIRSLEEEGIIEIVRAQTSVGDSEINVYRPRFIGEEGRVKMTLPQGQNDPTGRVKMTPTIAATAAGEVEIFQLFLRCAEIDRDPTGEELEIIRQLLASGIPQETIQAGIEQAFRNRRQADGIPTLAQCARVARRLHHREHREHDAETTDRIPAADHTTGTIAASGLAAHADPLADVWAALREGSCPECNYDTAAYRLGLRHLAGDAEQVYRAVIETIAYGVPPDRLVGYVRSILDRWAAEAQGAMVEVDAARAADGSPTLSESAQGSGAAEEQVWKTALVELRHQMTKATFDTWLCGTRLVQCADSVATIAVRSEYARDWLANRLRPVVARTLSGVLGRQVEVQFVVNDQARLSVGSA